MLRSHIGCATAAFCGAMLLSMVAVHAQGKAADEVLLRGLELGSGRPFADEIRKHLSNHRNGFLRLVAACAVTGVRRSAGAWFARARRGRATTAARAAARTRRS